MSRFKKLSKLISKEITVSRFKKTIKIDLALQISYCLGSKISIANTHWCIATETAKYIRAFSEQLKYEIIELNIQKYQVLVMILPKVPVSKYVGIVKGRSAIKIFNKVQNLKIKLYLGNHFWAEGYCVETIGIDEEMIRKYMKYQDDK